MMIYEFNAIKKKSIFIDKLWLYREFGFGINLGLSVSPGLEST